MSRSCILVNGISRHGKSYWTKNTAIPEMAAEKPVIIFDRVGEYTAADEDVPSAEWEQHQSTVNFYENIEQENEGIIEGVHVIRCTNDQDYRLGLGFFKALQQPVYIVLDEAHDIFLSTDLRKAKESLIQLTRYGGHYGIDLLLVSQRTKDLPPDFRSQITGVVSFKQTHEGDLKALKSMGFQNVDEILDLDKQNYKILGEIPNNLNKK